MAQPTSKFPRRAQIRKSDKTDWKKLTDEGTWELSDGEVWWRDHYNSLQSAGYELRPRFRPGWTPSWVGANLIPTYCEDCYPHHKSQVLDATRDGRTVAIKQVLSGTNEIHISKMLSTPERLRDPLNHCVPILDHFHDPSDVDVDYLVMPLLRAFNDPPFFSVDEVLDFVMQTLEGLVYIHLHGVAHRDCSDRNIMMCGDALYPKGFHPSWQERTLSCQESAMPLRRRDVRRVKYYFIDFGISTHFEDENEPRSVRGQDGLDQEVPELSRRIPYNPFPVDIFILGNLYKKTFIEQYKNMEFLEPLTHAMTQKDPTARPTAADALTQFQSIVARQADYALRWRLQSRNERFVPGIVRDFGAVAYEALFRTKWLASKVHLMRAPSSIIPA